MLKLPSDLIGYIFKFVDPNEFHRLYRVCKKFYVLASDRNILLTKLEYELNVVRSELEPLFDFPNDPGRSTPYLRYVLTLALYEKVIISSTAWLFKETCIKYALKAGDIELLKYFAGNKSDEYLGKRYTYNNLSKCIETYVRGESVKYNKKFEYDKKFLLKVFSMAKDIVRGKLPELDDDVERWYMKILLELAYKKGRFNIAYQIAQLPDMEKLNKLLLEDFVMKSDMESCRKLIEIRKIKTKKICKSTNKEFISEFFEKFPDCIKLNSDELWSPEFAEIFFKNVKSFKKVYIPALYMIKYRDTIISSKKLIRENNILRDDVYSIIYFVNRRRGEIKACPCGEIPLKPKLCIYECIISCNFCNRKTYGTCKYCKGELCGLCTHEAKCSCKREIICGGCADATCDECSVAICKDCKFNECNDCGMWLCQRCMKTHEDE